MVLTVNISETATAILDESNYVHISLLVEIKDGAVTYDSKTITISVFRYTASILTYSVALMVNEITQYKTLCQKQQTIQNSLSTFTNLVKAAV